MTLVGCSRCREPVLVRDLRCPHCGHARVLEASRATAAMLAIGGALTGCFPIAEPAYGIADGSWGDSSATDDGTDPSATTTIGSTTVDSTTQGMMPMPATTAVEDSSSSADDSSTTADDSSTTTEGSTGESETTGTSTGETDAGSGSDDGSGSSTG